MSIKSFRDIQADPRDVYVKVFDTPTEEIEEPKKVVATHYHPYNEERPGCLMVCIVIFLIVAGVALAIYLSSNWDRVSDKLARMGFMEYEYPITQHLEGKWRICVGTPAKGSCLPRKYTAEFSPKIKSLITWRLETGISGDPGLEFVKFGEVNGKYSEFTVFSDSEEYAPKFISQCVYPSGWNFMSQESDVKDVPRANQRPRIRLYCKTRGMRNRDPSLRIDLYFIPLG